MKSKCIFVCTIGAAALLMDGEALAQNSRADAGEVSRGKAAPVTAADQQFVMEAAKGGMMEVAMGEVAARNASSAEVKSFGSRMVGDHGRANNELKAIAARKNIRLPGKPSAGKWASDKDYMTMVVSDHQKDLALFEKEAKNGSDADLKRFAGEKANIVRGHLKMAQQISGKLK